MRPVPGCGERERHRCRRRAERGRHRGRPTGGTVRGAGRRGAPLGRHRGPRAPRGRSSSRRDGSGRVTAGRPRATGSHGPRRAAHARSGSPEVPEGSGEGGAHVVVELGAPEGGDLWPSAHQVCPRGYVPASGEVLERGAHPSPDPVAGHGVPGAAPEGVGDPGRARGAGAVIGQVGDPDRAGPAASAASPQLDERRPVPDPPDQADSRLRPLRRRALTIARPARSAMRWRKPWRRERRRLLGWKVRFTDWPPRGPWVQVHGRDPRPARWDEGRSLQCGTPLRCRARPPPGEGHGVGRAGSGAEPRCHEG